jgi:P4 family phage/plasmid primase-like protien
MKTTMREMHAMRTKLPPGTDKGVYHGPKAIHPQKYRTIYATKEKQTRFMIPVTETEDLTRHFVGIVNDDAIEFTYKHRPVEVVEPTAYEGDQSSIGDILKQTDDRQEWLKIGVSLRVVYGKSSNENQFFIDNANKLFDDIISRDYKAGGWSLLKKYLDERDINKFKGLTPPLNDDFTQEAVATWIVDTHIGPENIVYDAKSYWLFENHRWNTYNAKLSPPGVREALNSYKHFTTNSNILRQVGGANFRKGVNELIKDITANTKFVNNLNQNPYLLGFNNGVLDLKTKQFRAGRPDDMISMSTNTDYNNEIDDEKMRDLIKVLREICCQNEVHYTDLLKMIARTMVGDNSTTSQLFFCWHGRGSNGKSVLSQLIRETFGDYVKFQKTSMITDSSEGSSSRANPLIASIVGARWVFLEETEKNTEINVQTLKTHAGNDKLMYRALYGNETETKITWSLFLLTNDKIMLKTSDKGTMRRFIYFPFDASFEDKLENVDVENHRYKRDNYLMVRLKTYKNEFLHLLLKYLDASRQLELSPEIANKTLELARDCDILHECLKDLFEYSDKDKDAIKFDDLDNYFKSQYPSQYYQVRDKKLTKKLWREQVEARLPYIRVRHEQYRANCILTGSKMASTSLICNIRLRDSDAGQTVLLE